MVFLVFILQKEWLCLNCHTQRAVSGQLGEPVPPTMASPKKQPAAPAFGSFSTPAAVDSKPVVEPPPPASPKAKVVPLTHPQPDPISSCSVSEPLPDSQENKQKESLADENVSDVKQAESSSSETQDAALPLEGEEANQSAIVGIDATAAPAEVETEPQISQSVASSEDDLKVEPDPEMSPDVAEEPRPVLTTDAVLQEVSPQLERTSYSTVPTETECQIAAGEQKEPEPVTNDARLREGSPPLPHSQGEVAEDVGNVVSRTAQVQQEPNPAQSEESPTSSVSKSLISDGELQEPEPPEEVKDLRNVTQQNSEENKDATQEESVELKIPQRLDEGTKATENSDEEKNVGGEVCEPVKMEAGSENDPSAASKEQLVCNNAASETVNELKADEGKLPEEETEEKEKNEQKAPEEKVNGAGWSQSNDTEISHQEETEEKETMGLHLPAEEIPKDEAQKTIRTETETVTMMDEDKHQNRNTEKSAQMAPDVIKAKASGDALIQGGTETCSQQTNCNKSLKEANREEEQLKRGAQDKASVKDEEGKELASLIQETVSETEKSAGGDGGGTALPDCLKEEISNQQETERSFEDRGVAETVVSVVEPQILLDVANEQWKGSLEETTGREEPKEAEDQPLGKASDGETVAEVTVDFSEEEKKRL